MDVDGDSEALRVVVVPFADVRDPAEQHRETEPDHTLVEPLRAGPQPQATSLIHRQVDINSQMLMRAEVVDNPSPSVAVDHVRVEAMYATRLKSSDPRNGLTAELVDEGVVLDCQGNVSARLREHDSAPAADVEEWLGVAPALPDLVHHAAPDRRDTVGTREAESPLNLWME